MFGFSLCALGGSTSGIAFWQMGIPLRQKGYGMAGAATVMAVHSLIWKSNDPIGKGHPDIDDDQSVWNLVDKVAKRIESGDTETIPLSTLDYQPEIIQVNPQKKLGRPWANIPKSVGENAQNAPSVSRCVKQEPSR